MKLNNVSELEWIASPFGPSSPSVCLSRSNSGAALHRPLICSYFKGKISVFSCRLLPIRGRAAQTENNSRDLLLLAGPSVASLAISADTIVFDLSLQMLGCVPIDIMFRFTARIFMGTYAERNLSRLFFIIFFIFRVLRFHKLCELFHSVDLLVQNYRTCVTN